MERIDYIMSAFSSCKLDITADQAEKYLKLYEFMVEYNEKVNLTAITDFEDVVTKHFIDSVLPFTLTEIKENSSIIDVGTGAGFPSIPLMIYRNDIKMTLLEALNKRCTYLEKACRLVGVYAKIVHGRAEDYAKEKREAFDYSTARAVAAMPVLSEYCLPYVKVGGRFVALKSLNEEIDDAKKAIEMLGGELCDTIDYNIPNGDKRRLFIVKKISHTSSKYPRNPAMIKKKPL